MNHIAIMRKSWGLTGKIFGGAKSIESRWLSIKCAPWNKITKGDTVYFKNSGEPVRLKTTVKGVIQFSGLTQQRVKRILDKYGKEDGIEPDEQTKFYKMFKNKNYCILVFLENPKKTRPFNIDKSGFGVRSSWITVDNTAKIKSD